MATKSKKPKVLAIPKREHILPDEVALKITDKYRTLRLTALQRSPEAFTSTYAREIQFNDETWISRAFNPLAKVLVALSTEVSPRNTTVEFNDDNHDGHDSIEKILIERRWLGQLTLMGPVLMPINNEKYKHAPWELFKDIDYSKAARDAQRIPAGSKVLYVLVGMYVLPEGRGVGNGRRLLEAAIEAVKEEASGKSVKAAVVVLVACGNKKAKRLYERVEFVPWEETVDIEGEKHWPMSLDITS